MKWIGFLAALCGWWLLGWGQQQKTNNIVSLCARAQPPGTSRQWVFLEAFVGDRVGDRAWLWDTRVRNQNGKSPLGSLPAFGSLPVGHRVGVWGRLRCRYPYRNPGHQEDGPLRRDTPWIGIEALRVERLPPRRGDFFWRAVARFRSQLERPGYPWLSALARATWTGDLAAFPYSVQRLYRELGVSHVLALSGQHLFIFCAAWWAAVRWAYPYLYTLYPRGLARLAPWLRPCVSLVSVAILLSVSHFQLTLWRLSGFLVWQQCFRSFQFPVSSLRVLVFSLAVTSALCFSWWASPGFVLSAVASAWIMRLSPTGLLQEGGRLSCWMPILMVPLSLFYFGTFNLWSVFANLMLVWSWSLVWLPLGFVQPLMWGLPDGLLSLIEWIVCQFFLWQTRVLPEWAASGFLHLPRPTVWEFLGVLSLMWAGLHWLSRREKESGPDGV